MGGGAAHSEVAGAIPDIPDDGVITILRSTRKGGVEVEVMSQKERSPPA